MIIINDFYLYNAVLFTLHKLKNLFDECTIYIRIEIVYINIDYLNSDIYCTFIKKIFIILNSTIL